ncbi:MAG: CDP-diacylglycerol diphosphatase [Methylococcus sp.]
MNLVVNTFHLIRAITFILVILTLNSSVRADVNDIQVSTTEQCPNPAHYPKPLPSPDDPDHWYSPAADNLGDKASEQCNSCEDPQNNVEASCIVYKTLTTTCQGKTSCTVSQKGTFNLYPKWGYALEHDLRYTDQSQPKYKNDTCHMLIFALSPTIGIEDSNHRDNYNYWPEAYYASQHLMNPAIPNALVGLAINPATQRTQHQLHIHIGQLTKEFRGALDLLEENPSKVQNVTLAGHSFKAKFVRDNRQGPFTGFSPFEVASNLAGGEKFIPEHGIIGARAKSKKGIFVLVVRNVFVEGLLKYDYRAPKACQLAKK